MLHSVRGTPRYALGIRNSNQDPRLVGSQEGTDRKIQIPGCRLLVSTKKGPSGPLRLNAVVLKRPRCPPLAEHREAISAGKPALPL